MNHNVSLWDLNRHKKWLDHPPLINGGIILILYQTLKVQTKTNRAALEMSHCSGQCGSVGTNGLLWPLALMCGRRGATAAATCQKVTHCQGYLTMKLVDIIVIFSRSLNMIHRCIAVPVWAFYLSLLESRMPSQPEVNDIQMSEMNSSVIVKHDEG